MTFPAPLQVFVGGAIGGAIRLGIDYAIPAGSHGIPWEILAVNVVGSFTLGIVAAHDEARGGHRHFPLIGPGLLGGFTTFSALAALLWTASAGTIVSWALLAANLLLAVGAAAWGWGIGAQGTRTSELIENLENEPVDGPSTGRGSATNGGNRP